jgi:hypothetical protein
MTYAANTAESWIVVGSRIIPWLVFEKAVMQELVFS